MKSPDFARNRLLTPEMIKLEGESQIPTRGRFYLLTPPPLKVDENMNMPQIETLRFEFDIKTY